MNGGNTRRQKIKPAAVIRVDRYLCSMNYFELFELPVSLQVDKAELNKRYIAVQKKYHPDFFTQANEQEQRDALEQSSLANKGLKILQQPDELIHYVLELKGLVTAGEKYSLPPDFLMEMMELNEQLTADNTAAARQEIENLEQALWKPVQSIVENYQDARVSEADLLLLKEYYFKKKYLHRILDRMDD